jgi:ribose/xylose/arabinose/galactoside ABC-type transport system permease subunit
VLGVLLIAMINNGFNILGLSTFYQGIAQGVIIFLAVAIDGWSRRGVAPGGRWRRRARASLAHRRVS